MPDTTVTIELIGGKTIEYVGYKARLDTDDRVLILSRRGEKDKRLTLYGIKTWKTTTGCICEDGDTWACIDGTIYGPCSSDLCSGVCESDSTCDCEATEHKPGRHGTPWPDRKEAL